MIALAATATVGCNDEGGLQRCTNRVSTHESSHVITIHHAPDMFVEQIISYCGKGLTTYNGGVSDQVRQAWANCTIAVAGVKAVGQFLGNSQKMGVLDLELLNASTSAILTAQSDGKDVKPPWSTTAPPRWTSAEEIRQACDSFVETTLTKHGDEFEVIRDALINDGFASKDDIVALIGPPSPDY